MQYWTNFYQLYKKKEVCYTRWKSIYNSSEMRVQHQKEIPATIPNVPVDDHKTYISI